MRKWDLSVADYENARRRSKEAREAIEEERKRQEKLIAKEAEELETQRLEDERRIEEAVDDPNVTKVIKEVVMVNGRMIREQKLVKKVVKEVAMVNGEMIDGEVEERDETLEDEKPLTKQQKKKKLKRLAKKEAARKVKEELEKEASLAQAKLTEVEEGEISTEDLLRAQENEEAQLDALRDKMKYDETLLAVIGILDHIKYEGNIAGWVRSGGLLRIDSFEDVKPVTKRGVSPPPTPSPRRQRIGDNFNLAIVDEHISLPSTLPPPSSSPQNMGVGSSSADSEESLSPGFWFERPAVMRYWVGQGRRALEELDIEAVSGIRSA